MNVLWISLLFRIYLFTSQRFDSGDHSLMRTQEYVFIYIFCNISFWTISFWEFFTVFCSFWQAKKRPCDLDLILPAHSITTVYTGFLLFINLNRRAWQSPTFCSLTVAFEAENNFEFTKYMMYGKSCLKNTRFWKIQITWIKDAMPPRSETEAGA